MKDKEDKIKKIFYGLFFLVYVLFVGIDINLINGFPVPSYAIKYIGIILVVAFAVFLKNRQKNQDGKLVLAALGITLAADFFLLFTPYYVAGVTIFCAAHLVYICRYRKKFGLRITVPTVLLLAVVHVLLSEKGSELSLLYAVCGIYGILIITATICAEKAENLPRRSRRAAVAGMILFILCDINVALFQVLPKESPILGTVSVLMWVFYYPSQILIAQSIAYYSRLT